MRLLLRPYARFFDLTGRSRRAEGWLWLLTANILILAVGGLIYALNRDASEEQLTKVAGLAFGAFAIINIVPLTTLQIRRFHDLGTTGWWTILTYLPLLGYVVALASWLLPGQRGSNRYGPDPRRADASADTVESADQMPQERVDGAAPEAASHSARGNQALGWLIGSAAATALLVAAGGGYLVLQRRAAQPSFSTTSPISKALPARFSTADLKAAFQAAFGKPPAARVGDLEFSPDRLIAIGGKVALISMGVQPDGCHGCSGAIAVHYLQRAGTTFKVVGRWMNVDSSGSNGDAPEVVERQDLLDNPVLELKSGGTFQGCSASATKLVELTPNAPVAIASLTLDAETEIGQEGASENIAAGGEDENTISGKIEPGERGHSFRAVYSKPKPQVITFARRGKVFTPIVATDEVPANPC